MTTGDLFRSAPQPKPKAEAGGVREADAESDAGEDNGRKAVARRTRRNGDASGATQTAVAAPRKEGGRRRGRPEELPNSVVVTVRLPSELVQKIDYIVENSDHVYRDRSELIRQTVAMGLRETSKVRPATPQRKRGLSTLELPVITPFKGEVLAVVPRSPASGHKAGKKQD